MLGIETNVHVVSVEDYSAGETKKHSAYASPNFYLGVEGGGVCMPGSLLRQTYSVLLLTLPYVLQIIVEQSKTIVLKITI